MFELVIAIAIAAPIVLLLRKVSSLHLDLIEVREKCRDEFYKTADEVVQWENASDDLLAYLSSLSSSLSSRRMQVLAIQVVKSERLNESRSEDARESTPTAYLPPELKLVWKRLFFNWLVAVCAQGSIIGF